jgi:hypothetical protein
VCEEGWRWLGDGCLGRGRGTVAAAQLCLVQEPARVSGTEVIGARKVGLGHGLEAFSTHRGQVETLHAREKVAASAGGRRGWRVALPILRHAWAQCTARLRTEAPRHAF